MVVRAPIIEPAVSRVNPAIWFGKIVDLTGRFQTKKLAKRLRNFYIPLARVGTQAITKSACETSPKLGGSNQPPTSFWK